MSPSLVYLHIPKSAGTSHRAYLNKVFGEENVFWYGLNSEATKFKVRDIGTSLTLGGHRPLTFYPRSFDALYTSVVRDPVERAVSFFNYCTTSPESSGDEWLKNRQEAQEKWRDLGIDPSSLSRSIERCDEFRREITNLQCSYLSRHGATFEGVLKTLEEESMVIGAFDQLPLFNNFLQTELNFPLENRVRANVGRVGYSSGIFKEPGVASLIRSINVEDQLLCDFVRLQHGGLYVGATNVSSVRNSVPVIESNSNLAKSDMPISWNQVHLFSKGILQIDDNGKAVATLVVRNATNEHLVFSKLNGGSRSIGWQVLNEIGGKIEGLCGTVEAELTIPPRKFRVLTVSFCLNDEMLRNEKKATIEFCIVEGESWLNQQYPLSSAWSKLFLPSKLPDTPPNIPSSSS